MLFGVAVPGTYFGVFESESEVGALVWYSIPAFLAGTWWLVWLVCWVIDLFRPGLVFADSTMTLPPHGAFQFLPATVAYRDIGRVDLKRASGGPEYILVEWNGGRRKLWYSAYPERHKEILQILLERTQKPAGEAVAPSGTCASCGHVNPSSRSRFCGKCGDSLSRVA